MLRNCCGFNDLQFLVLKAPFWVSTSIHHNWKIPNYTKCLKIYTREIYSLSKLGARIFVGRPVGKFCIKTCVIFYDPCTLPRECPHTLGHLVETFWCLQCLQNWQIVCNVSFLESFDIWRSLSRGSIYFLYTNFNCILGIY